MTKDEALKKYAAEIVENDHLGLGQALVARMENDNLFKLAVGGLVKEVYTIQDKLKEREQLIESYKEVVNDLTIKNRMARKAFVEITEWCSMDEGHEMHRIATEALEGMEP
jgi:hypothetical protein